MTGATVPNVLSIAGSDPSGGAGIQADLKTFAALAVHGGAVITALTAQNTVRISGVFPVPVAFLREQLDAVFSDMPVDAVKVGMLAGMEAVRTVADVLRAVRPPFVVLDPVVSASTGARLLSDEGIDALREELLPLVTLVTPNAHEAGVLLGSRAPRTVAEAHGAAHRLVTLGCHAALVTGGHLEEPEHSVDVLHDGATMHELRVPRVPGEGTHGSGCTLSSAVAAFLARGLALHEACALAQRFVADAIARSGALRAGRGRAPVHQLGAIWSRAAANDDAAPHDFARDT